MKKVVFLTSRFPFPLNKGDKLRVFHQLKTLAEKVEIHLICINDQEIAKQDLKELAPFCQSITVFVLPFYKRIISLVASIGSSIPLQVAYFYNGKIAQEITAKIEAIQADHIHCHLIRTTEYVKHISAVSKSLDFMDAFAAGMEKRELTEKNPFKRFLFNYEKKLLRAYESRVFQFIDRFCIISNQDREAIHHPSNHEIKIVSNGVDFSVFYPRNEVKRYDLVFMGNMSYPPNIVAVTYLVEEILPLLQLARPETSLLIAGIGASKKIKNYQSKQIAVIEHFDDISDSIAFSRIMVAPMLISIGLQNKIIQAMAMKVPCVVSPSANVAISAIPNESIIEADSPTNYSREIIALLEDDHKREQLANKAFEFVKGRYTWQLQNEVLHQLFHGAEG